MSRRRLSTDERSLWKHVTRSIAPLRKAVAGERDVVELPSAEPLLKSAAKAKPIFIRPTPVVVKPSSPPALAPLGRRFS